MDYATENQYMRSDDAYNLRITNRAHCAGPWDFPPIHFDETIEPPPDLIGFNYAKTNRDKNVGIHFFLDDYQFERVWRRPESYTRMLSQYWAVLTPDFSTYLDMPLPMRLWNMYRSRALGHWWQRQGIPVIPTLQWSDETSLAYSFNGLPHGGIVAVSTVGARKTPEAEDNWRKGIEAALVELAPHHVIHHGRPLDGIDWHGAEVHCYTTQTERMKNDGRTRR